MPNDITVTIKLSTLNELKKRVDLVDKLKLDLIAADKVIQIWHDRSEKLEARLDLVRGMVKQMNMLQKGIIDMIHENN